MTSVQKSQDSKRIIQSLEGKAGDLVKKIESINSEVAQKNKEVVYLVIYLKYWFSRIGN